ncbi:MAG: hypothetical protein V3S64_09870 [bacterium]
MSLYDSFKGYVFNENWTPYLTRTHRLTRFQARKELFVYCVFMAMFFAVIALAARAKGRSAGAGLPGWLILYDATLFVAAVLIGATKRVGPALYCLPASATAYLSLQWGITNPNVGLMDHVFLLVIAVFLFWYGLRILAIVRFFPDMPEEPPPPTRRQSRFSGPHPPPQDREPPSDSP